MSNFETVEVTLRIRVNKLSNHDYKKINWHNALGLYHDEKVVVKTKKSGEKAKKRLTGAAKGLK